MPTIDQLAPATAASDTDELVASQNGIARKVTRAQLTAGLQPQLALPGSTLLGRSSAGIGAPELLSLGANLTLNNGTLSATASPFQIAQLPAGTVPVPSDQVAIGQNGTNVSVSYAQFVNGLSKLGGIDISSMTVTPSGSGAGQKIADVVAAGLLKAGGVMTGPLTLAGDPMMPLQAATKQYVDNQSAAALPRTGGVMAGPVTLAANPTASMQAATKQYVDTQIATALPLTGGTVTGALSAPSISIGGAATVAGRLTASAISATQIGTSSGTLVSEIALQRTSTGSADAPALTSAVTVNHPGGGASSYSNAAFPTIVNNALDANGHLIDGPTTPVRSINSVLVVNAVAGSTSQPQHAAISGSATKNAPPGGYPAGRLGPQVCGLSVPVSDATNQPSAISNATLGSQAALSANHLDPGNLRIGHQVALSDAIPLSSGGVPVEWSAAIATTTTTDAWYKWHISATGNYSIAVLDTRAARSGTAQVTSTLSVSSTTISVDPVLPFASAGVNGQPISASNTAAVQIGASLYTLVGVTLDGAGRTSGKLTFSTPVSVTDGTAGNLVVGASRAIWLGSGQQLALDTGGTANLLYDAGAAAIRSTVPVQVTGTLSVSGAAQLGTTTVKGSLGVVGAINASSGLTGSSVSVSGAVNAGGSLAVGGALTAQGGAAISGGLLALPSYAVAALPTASAGVLAYAANGRKPGEALGAGSGVLVWGTSNRQWLSILSGTPVQA